MTPSQRARASQQATNAMHSRPRWRQALVRQWLTPNQREPTRSEATKREGRRPTLHTHSREHGCYSGHRVGLRWRHLAWPKKVCLRRRTDRREGKQNSAAHGRVLGREVVRLSPTVGARTPSGRTGRSPRRPKGPRWRFCAFGGQRDGCGPVGCRTWPACVAGSTRRCKTRR